MCTSCHERVENANIGRTTDVNSICVGTLCRGSYDNVRNGCVAASVYWNMILLAVDMFQSFYVEFVAVRKSHCLDNETPKTCISVCIYIYTCWRFVVVSVLRGSWAMGYNAYSGIWFFRALQEHKEES